MVVHAKANHLQRLWVRTMKVSISHAGCTLTERAILTAVLLCDELNADGPNVAYYGYDSVHYSTLELVLDELESMGENPLVVMPFKYVQPVFRTSGYRQKHLSQHDLQVIERCVSKNFLYSCSVCRQTLSVYSCYFPVVIRDVSCNDND
jgi:hypothetical protein